MNRQQMNYKEAEKYLFDRLAFFQRDGAKAFKKDLSKTIHLLQYLGNPQNEFKTIHVAGTNGKGSSSHSLASIMQSAGYKTGLYTSPHLISFRERIRLDGVMVEESFIADFVSAHKTYIEEYKPSFFEVTVAMAFQYFAQAKVDIAVIEVGMGGRLDSTNLVNPVISLITNIGYDHQQYLGDTLALIAGEKAGIIKKNVPVVISERQVETTAVFEDKAKQTNSTISFASDHYQVLKNNRQGEGEQVVDVLYKSEPFYQNLKLGVLGDYYLKNVPGVLEVVHNLSTSGYDILPEHVRQGLAEITALTGLKGRWQCLNKHPLIFCDVGHNEAGIKEVLHQISLYQYSQLHIVYGTVNDKDVAAVVKLLPKKATYYLCKPNLSRGMPLDTLSGLFDQHALKYSLTDSVASAIAAAKEAAAPDDFIFIGGSTFVVAEIPELLHT